MELLSRRLFSQIRNTSHAKTMIFTSRKPQNGSLFCSRGAPKGLLQRTCKKRPSNITLLGPNGVQKRSPKVVFSVSNFIEIQRRQMQKPCFRLGGIANSMFLEINEFRVFYASAKLERKCPRGRLLEKCANPSQVPHDISHGISLGAPRAAPGILFGKPQASKNESDAPPSTKNLVTAFQG